MDSRMKIRSIARTLTGALFVALLAWYVTLVSGCSAGKQGLMSITPQQYFFSAKEALETIDERNYEERDLDEIIRVLMNAEKDAKKQEIIDKSRLYLVLANTLKARKQWETQRLNAKFVGGRPEPLFELDIKPIQETLRVAKKWLRSCRAGFKTNEVASDLEYVEGMYFTMKMLTQRGGERDESLWTAVDSLRHCLARTPAYKSDFRLFGRVQGPRDVRLQMIETLALGGQVTDAYELVSEYNFQPAFPREDLPWLHAKGLVLAMQGRFPEAIEALAHFKIVAPQDYPRVDGALWLLEGVYAALAAETKDRNFDIESKIVQSQLGELKGPFSKSVPHSASSMFPRWLPGDRELFATHAAFCEGRYKEASSRIKPLLAHGLLSARNRARAQVLALEAAIYGGEVIIDTVLEEVLQVAIGRGQSSLMRDRIGNLLARYLVSNDQNFTRGRIDGAHQSFAKALLSQPCALNLGFERPAPPKDTSTDTPINRRRERRHKNLNAAPAGNPEATETNSASLLAEITANKAEDWVVSASISLVELPRLVLLGKGKLVGKEEGEGSMIWRFKGADIDELRRGGHYLAILEYTNSDNDPSLQGTLLHY